MKYIIILLLIIQTPVVAMADAIGTWRLYNCYSDIQQIQPAGDDVFVLASGNLYSYNTKDNSLTTYDKTTCLNSNDITRIAWVQQAKRLVIAYSNHSIDFLSLNQDVVNINDLADKQMAGDKTLNDIYVSGKYAYLSTGFGIVKINVTDAYIVDTYNLGCKVDYCYIEGSTIYAASSTNGLLSAALSANLLDKNVWSRVGGYTPKTIEAYTYDAHNNCYWGANADSQLTKYKKLDDGEYQENTTFIPVKPDGPVDSHFYELTISDDVLYAGAGTIHPMYNNRDYEGQVHQFKNDTWSVFVDDVVNKTGHSYRQVNKVVVDPTNKNHTVALAQTGIYEFLNGKLYRHWNCKNTNGLIGSALPEHKTPEDWNIIIGAIFDNKGGLWVPCYTGILYLPAGSDEWENYGHEDMFEDFGCEPYFSSLSFDNRGLLWFAAIRANMGTVFCYDIQKDVLVSYDSYVNQDGTSIGEYRNIFRIAHDSQNNVWAATPYGPVYLDADDLTSGRADHFVQHKVPRNDGTNFADYLLSGVDVRCIAIDVFNRKWIGTSGSGIFLISSDNNTQLAHFTAENSCLPSNEVLDLAINRNDGKVWISTFSGICSYQSDITSTSDGQLSEGNVYAYPNPVTPDHSGDVTIVGLSDGAQVFITTSSGHVLSTGIALGGSFRWNGCDTSGRRVASGVYMVLVAASDGTKGVVSKIAVVR